LISYLQILTTYWVNY